VDRARRARHFKLLTVAGRALLRAGPCDQAGDPVGPGIFTVCARIGGKRLHSVGLRGAGNSLGKLQRFSCLRGLLVIYSGVSSRGRAAPVGAPCQACTLNRRDHSIFF